MVSLRGVVASGLGQGAQFMAVPNGIHTRENVPSKGVKSLVQIEGPQSTKSAQLSFEMDII